MEKFLWYKEFESTKLSDLILPTKYRKSFQKYLNDKEIPHLFLFSNSPGSGKTTTAKMFVHELKAEHLFINCSNDNGIGILRSKITHFVNTQPFLEKYECNHKIIILDEFDGASVNLQDGLRSFMDDYGENVRFIATANKNMKIIGPLQSRFTSYDFNMNNKDIKEDMIINTCKRVMEFLKNKNVVFDKDTILNLILNNFPDLRKTLNILQQYSNINSDIIDKSILKYNIVDKDFIDLILNKKFNNARKYYLENGLNEEDVFRSLYDDYLNKIPKDIYAQSLVIIAEYLYRNSTVVDKEINLSACIMELISLLK